MKKDKISQEKILLSHGSGGRYTHKLITELFIKEFGNPVLNKLDDSATFDWRKGRIAFTTDSYVVKPIFFPGGDIGKLSICGTVNDLAMVGATPLFISVGFLIEEGLDYSILQKIVYSMREASNRANVKIVTGDTKVVDHNALDQIFINTSGIGFIPNGINISSNNAIKGDKIILSGTIGDHGIAVLSQRENLGLQSKLKSDCAPLNGLVQDMLKASKNIRCMRDPTRGGLSASLNEIASSSNIEITIDEKRIPILPEVKGVCELLGFDPLHIANEGKLIAFVKDRDASKILRAMRKNIFGRRSEIIGEVIGKGKATVILETAIGSKRILDMPSGELLPRIC